MKEKTRKKWLSHTKEIVDAGQLDREAGEVLLEANSDAAVLVLSGEPLNDPIVGYGPFVMNSEAQIAEALEDLHAGRFGRIAPQTKSGAN